MSLLVLAGTREARQILWALADSGRPVVASLAGATERPEPLTTRIRAVWSSRLSRAPAAASRAKRRPSSPIVPEAKR